MTPPLLPHAPWKHQALVRVTRFALLVLAALIVVAACAGTGSSDDSDDTNGSAEPGDQARATPSESAPPATPEPAPQADAEILPLPQRQWTRMTNAGMVRPECPIQDPTELRVVAVNHYDFDGNIKRGRLVVNADVAESLVRIFTKIFERKFPIEQMSPVEEFGGDTNASLAANNTSAFNCRRADQINAPFAESPHANGRAIDINPVENPWMDLRCDCWFPSAKYQERVERPGGINEGGFVWRLFRDEGWIWQNIDVADYMHFDTGYPSEPFTGGA